MSGVNHTVAAPLVPRLFLRHFTTLSKLGSGSFGSVYHASVNKPSVLDGAPDEVALKKVKYDPLSNESRKDVHIERDAHALISAHPNVATIYGTISEPDAMYFVMEYVSGETLLNAIEDNSPMKHSIAVEIALQIARVLAHMHALGIAHRDIKWNNVMLTHPFVPIEGENHVKVIDFGFATRFNPSDASTRMNTDAIGTEVFMSLGATRGEAHDITNSDVFALGMLLYEMLSGIGPFDGDEEDSALWRRNTYLRKNDGPDFHAPVWETIGDLTKELLSDILFYDDDTCPTAAEVVERLQNLEE